MTRQQQIETWIGEVVGELPAAGASPVSVGARDLRQPDPFAEGTVPTRPRPSGIRSPRRRP